MSDDRGATVPIAGVATVDVDLPCFFCGYNLRSLALDGRCPECGNPVQKAIRHRWLDFADPVWLAKLRRGVTTILWMLLAVVFCYGAFTCYMMYTAMGSMPSVPPSMFGMQIVSTLLGVGFTITWLICVWSLTAPEPVPEEHPHQSSLARTTRLLHGISGCLVIVFAFAGTAVLFFSDPASTSAAALAGTSAITLMTYTSIPCGILGAVAFLLLLVHMRRIARRNITRGLGKLMTCLIWGSGALAGAWTLSMGFVMWSISTFAATVPTTTAPTPLAATTAQVALTPTVVSPSPFYTEVVVSQAGTTTLPATATTMPAGALAAGPPPFPFGGRSGFVVFALVGCGTQLLALAWFVAGVVALFWFRKVFTRAIRQNAGHSFHAAARQA